MVNISFYVSDLQHTTLALDFRITALENGGGDANCSVAELEVRVEVFEGTAADHETRITAAESDIQGKQSINRMPNILKYIYTSV